MPGKERRRRVRGESMALDTLHIVIGAAVVVMAVISFINPEEYMFFFPVIFLLAAIFRQKRKICFPLASPIPPTNSLPTTRI